MRVKPLGQEYLIGEAQEGFLKRAGSSDLQRFQL